MSGNLPAVRSGRGPGIFESLRALVPFGLAKTKIDPTDMFEAASAESSFFALRYKNFKKGRFVAPSEHDGRDKWLKFEHPFFPWNMAAGKAILGSNPLSFRSQLRLLADRLEFTEKRPEYRYQTPDENQVETGDVTSFGVDPFEVVRVRLKLSLFKLSDMLTLGQQTIEREILSKLSLTERRAVQFQQQLHDPLLLPDYSDTGMACYYVVNIPDIVELKKLGLDGIKYFNEHSFHAARSNAKDWDSLPDVARYLYDQRGEFNTGVPHVLEVRQLDMQPVELPASLHGELVELRALAKLQGDERRYVEQQRKEQQERQRARLKKLGLSGGVNQADEHIESKYIWMSYSDRDGLRGTVVAGNFRNRELNSLSTREIFELHEECRSDTDSLKLCEAYMDFIRPPGWRQTTTEDFRSAAGEMTLPEAYEILGVEPNVSDEDVTAAYRGRLKTAHPDVGGSEAEGTRVNLAMDRIRQDRPGLQKNNG